MISQASDAEIRAQQAEALREGRLNYQGKSPALAAPTEPLAIEAAKLAIGLADLVLVCSVGDHSRLERLSGIAIPRWTLLPTPPLDRVRAPHATNDVTIFAPRIRRSDLLAVESALAHISGHVQIVSLENSKDSIYHGIVVLVEMWRTELACRLAANGYRVAAPVQSGVTDRYSGTATFELTDPSSIADAVDRLIADQAPIEKLHVEHATIQRIALSHRPASAGPTISIILRTADRPALLKRALASLTAQTYDQVEIVVVDNGRDDVEEFVRLLTAGRRLAYVRPQTPVGIGAALNLGITTATGTYVGYLDDDDILYPDHCALSIQLLERAQADVCYSNCVGEYSSLDQSGTKRVLGMQMYTNRPYRGDELHVSNFMTIHSVVHRRSLFERFGYVDESLPVTEDWELWLRFSVGGARFIHLDRATCEYSWRDDPNAPNTSTERRHVFAQAYDDVIKRYQFATAGRTATILSRQQQNLAHLRARAEQIARDPAAAIALNMRDVMAHAAPVEGLDDISQTTEQPD